MSVRDLILLERESDRLPDYADDRLVRLLDYWWSKRGGDPLPSRRDVDPIDLPDLLKNMLILDVEDDTFRFRLVGESLNERYDGRLKGHTIDEVLTSLALDDTREEHRMCVSDRAPVFTINTEQTRSVFEDFQVYQRLILPVADNGRDVDTIIGCMLFMPPAYHT